MSKRKTSSKTDEPYIEQLKKEIDEFKFQIDELCDNELPHLGAASPDRLSVYQRATGLKAELSSLNQKLEGISLSDTGLSTKAFESKKGAEKQRLNKLQRRLDHISEQLEPDEVEEDYFRTLASDDEITKSEQSKELDNTRNEDETEVYDDDEYYGDAISDDGSGPKEDCVLAETLTVYKAEQDGDLSFGKGEHLEILEQSEDGWWFARNQVGKEGVIPSTLIKIIDAQEKDEAGGTVEKLGKRSGQELWNILKEKKPTTKEASINDVLKAMKAMPSGFRTSTLGTWFQKEEYRTATWVIPKLTSSKLQFRDLHWDGINKKLREYPVKMCRTFSLINVRCVPPLGAGVEVLSRHVYVAIWDEKKIISNIHRIRAIPLEKESNWTFTPKMGKNVPSLYDGDFVARVNSDDRKLSILFEFNYTYKRTSTGQQGDICCGWASLPLFEMDGTPYPNKTFEININGGTPFETDVPLDATTNLAASGTLMQSLIRGNQQPRMTVRSTGMNKTSKETYDMLPSTIVTCQKYAPFISFYRQHAAIAFCRDDNIPSDYVCDSLLSYFPRALSFPDLMDALKMVWDEKLKSSLTRTQRKDLGQLLKTFKQSFIESAFGLMQCSNIPPFVWADDAAEKARYSFIQTFLMQKDPLGNLLNPDYRHKPLLVNKLTFTVLSQHCVDPPPLDQASLAI